MDSSIKLSDTARLLHDTMSAAEPGSLFTQQQVQNMIGSTSLGTLMPFVQELLDKNLIRLVKQNNELKFQPVNVSEAQKKASMSADEALVYSYIEASGREGIWTKTIKAKTNLHQHVVLKCLKSLESQRYVKSVKSVKYPTRKIYMLYNLQPSVDVTGGPWFTDSELDVEFINSLLTIVWRHTAEKTYPNGFNNFNTSDNEPLYTHNVKNYSTTDEILSFISGARVSTVELSKADIRSLCEVLVYDGKLEKVNLDCYRVTLQSVLQMGGHKGKHDSETKDYSIFEYAGVISPSNAEKEVIYMDEWML
ncbi:HGL190Cp [Eremothecium sinecaudum]|uniref:DNA-directed RNA polymerase III subunit RPC6 n=1 Tax=Eremothecium sinecaudum TaxID=45286 RepID=A0A0X8HVB5_9SACH|nr:HGL190Cp [Eremothecium sinecaudum]AMD22150.1 HGL190Cp [Eremothecium sinecaudum]